MAYDRIREVWIVAAVRTPIGRHGGALSGVRPDDLGAHVLRSIVERSGVPEDAIEEVSFGCANGAGEDNRNVARMSLLLAGYPPAVAGVTVNRLCGSGLEAVAHGARSIMVGDADVCVAGGVESMTRSPLAMAKPSRRFETGDRTVHDTTIGWRFVNPRMEELGHTDPLGVTAENLVAERWVSPGDPDADEVAGHYDISRERQDAFALASHRKACAAAESGAFDAELVPVPVDGGAETVDRDEGPRADTSLERLAALRPAFVPGGTVTAGNSSGINDGAAALMLVTADFARAHGLAPLARIRSTAAAGVPPRVMGIGPVPATVRALERASISLDDLDLIELNEAFAAQVLAVLHEWGVDASDSRLNPNGGAIALGHPLGCSGARLLTTLVHEMHRRPDAELGLATMCIGVGQGISMVVERV